MDSWNREFFKFKLQFQDVDQMYEGKNNQVNP